jgi:hypothetical protein
VAIAARPGSPPWPGAGCRGGVVQTGLADRILFIPSNINIFR